MNGTRKTGKKALTEKLVALINSGSNCVFVTNLAVTPLPGDPKSNIKIDKEGNIWMLYSGIVDAGRFTDYSKQVQLFFSNNRSSTYLSVYGVATFIHGPELIDSLCFTDHVTADACLIKVVPGDIKAWKASGDKLTSLIRIMATAIAGKQVIGTV